MAQIDLKNTFIFLYEGSDLQQTTTIDSTAPDADIDITPVHMASPCAPISITFVDPPLPSEPLDVTLVGRDITVTLGTDVGSLAVSTSGEIADMINNGTGTDDVSDLISAVAEGTGLGVVDDQAQVFLTGPDSGVPNNNYLQIKIGEGNLTYNTKRPVIFTRDRGILDTVREADDEPMDVTIDFLWDFLCSVGTATIPTVEEALQQIGPAASWVNGASDPCQPYAVNIAVCNDIACGTEQDEVIEILEFYYEQLAHDLRAGTVSATGRANKQNATCVRVAEVANV